MVGNDGELLGVLKGPVWAPWPQTPQAAEYAAFAFCGAYADAPSVCFSDCQNVVDHVALGADVLCGRRQYTGLVLQGKHHFGTNLCALHKVSAHKDVDESGISASERFRRLGNRFADRAANEAALLHPSLAPVEVEELDRKIKIARLVLTAGSVLLPFWPRLEFRGTARSRLPPAPRHPPLEVGHSWVQVGSFWQCR
eukprot:9483650-Pyramimonas_sp.AAC.1